MNEKMTEVWAWVVAAFIYVIILWTVIAYFGEIVLCVRNLLHG